MPGMCCSLKVKFRAFILWSCNILLVLIKICFVDVLGVFESVVMVVFYSKNILKYIFLFFKNYF